MDEHALAMQDLRSRVTTKEFLTEWKEGFFHLREAFPFHGQRFKVRSDQEADGACWTLVEKPLPGVHLIAIHIDPMPHAMQVRVWVNQAMPEIYEQLCTAPAPVIRGERTVKFIGQNPIKSFKRDMKKKGITLQGVRYNVSNIGFLTDESRTVSGLHEIGMQFSSWLNALSHKSFSSAE